MSTTGSRPEYRMQRAHAVRVHILVNGRTLEAREGESVAAALLAAGIRTLRMTPRRGEPRGLFCGIGQCYDCLVEIDGEPGQRACMTRVRPGMRIRIPEAPA